MLLTVGEAAKRIRVSRACMYRLLGKRKIAFYRVGGRDGAIRIREEDLDGYLAQCRVEKGEEAPRLPRPRLKHLTL